MTKEELEIRISELINEFCDDRGVHVNSGEFYADGIKNYNIHYKINLKI
jgi:hypothetical protein